MTHEVTPRAAFMGLMEMVRTDPDCRRSIANQALKAYSLAVIDQAVPDGLWPGAETFARQQIKAAVETHSLTCSCITAHTKHALLYRQLPLSETSNRD